MRVRHYELEGGAVTEGGGGNISPANQLTLGI